MHIITCILNRFYITTLLLCVFDMQTLHLLHYIFLGDFVIFNIVGVRFIKEIINIFVIGNDYTLID